mmetsp:Transcript_51842/g.150822  ORF Transcript_51842/g.150822 Transcript_51842/m.150822 type:complete len:205 (+) Transcript_51842:1770-2384(+)
MQMPRSTMMSDMASAASYIFGPSPSSFAAHIQFPDALTDSSDVMRTKHRFVRASATASLAMARQLAGSPGKPFNGCSPMAVAPPVTERGPWAMQAKSARGVCSGPTHCCCAMRPVTDRSTLFVRKRFEPTETRRKTPVVSAAKTVRLGGSARARGGSLYKRFISKVFCGIFPRTLSKGKSTGVVLSRVSLTTILPSPVISPTTA